MSKSSTKLTDATVRALPVPATGNKIYYDKETRGFGCRVTAGGAKSFILNYRTKTGLERRQTIGSCADWSAGTAREEAKRLRLRVDLGEDPLGEQKDRRAAATVADLCKRFEDEYLPGLRASTQGDYKAAIEQKILPALGKMKVADVTYSDISALHRKISKYAPYQANRTVALLSKLFSEAVKWHMRPDNPAKGIKRNAEGKRHRYLSAEERGRLMDALAQHDDQQAAGILQVLLLTGARRGEVQGMRWAQIDFESGTWTKQSSETKQNRMHHVPLSAPVLLLLAQLRESASNSEFVFPGRGGKGSRVEIKSDWARICKAAGLKDLRIHDLRHSFASMLVSAGQSLPVVGALLGHSQAQTTLRYSHLAMDPLRQATESVGAIVTGQPSAEVVPMRKGK